MATGALGTGINIEGIIYVIHVDRLYGLTSFLQQSGRRGRNREISDSIQNGWSRGGLPAGFGPIRKMQERAAEL